MLAPVESPRPWSSVSRPSETTVPRSSDRPSIARAAFSYARTLKGFTPVNSRRTAISSRVRATSRLSMRAGWRLGEVFQVSPSGEPFVDGVPVPDAGLSSPPAEADDAVAGHRVEIDEAQLEIPDDAAAARHLGERDPEALERVGVGPLLSPQGANVGVARGDSGVRDRVQDLDLAAQSGHLLSQG